MRGLFAHYLLRGLGVERALERLRAQGVPLRDIRRMDARAVEVGCDAQDAQTLESVCRALGFQVRRLPPRGWLRRLRAAKGGMGLLLGAAVALCVLCYGLRFIWRVEIVGAGAYSGETRAFLKEKGISPGTPKASVDARALSEELQRRLPKVAWVRAEKSGVSLRVTLTLGVPPPAIESAGAAGDLIAARDGVVSAVRVYAGTPAVEAGDFVRAGDVLIRGEERGQSEEKALVRARGQVLASLWVSSAARAPAMETISLPTGRETRRRVLCTPFLRVADAPEPDYLTYDTDTLIAPLGGAWLPIWLERQTHIEVSLQEALLPEQDARTQAGALAMERLLTLCGGTDEIIDKWLDYSMIEGGIIEAKATAELLADIAVYGPETME